MPITMSITVARRTGRPRRRHRSAATRSVVTVADPNHRITLARRPDGAVRPDDFAADAVPVPEPADGEAVIRVDHLSIDPTIRTWVSDARSYFPPVEIGEVVRCSGVGHVVATRCDGFEVGDHVYSLPGWQEYAIVRDDPFSTRLEPDADPRAMLSVFGGNGVAAYVGILDIGAARAGETVLVSAAAGATGSIAGQIARLSGCRVVGIAGGEDKCAWLVDDAGFDAAVDHRAADFAAALKAATPDRVDVYFDNVGGRVLDAALHRLAMGGRVVLCGAISVYNDDHRPPGPSNYLDLITFRGRMEGFNAFDHWDRLDEVVDKLGGWMASGDLVRWEHVVNGLDRAPEALQMLFEGRNLGKVIVAVDGSAED
jgi:NADPH-dependent curcumin reductase CurA